MIEKEGDNVQLLKAKKIDATQGSLVPLIVSFAVPLILSTLVQTLFNAVDIAVLGQMADTTAVASVGATTTIVHLIIDAFVGLSSGAKIVLSRLFGKKDEEALRKTVDTSLLMALGLGLLVAALGFSLAPTFMRVVDCPAECFDGAVLYIRIYILAAPAVLLYNFGAAVLMSSGDTRRPLYYVIASGVLNAVLNVILCLILPQKVAAVAIATASSQVLAATLVMIRLCRMEGNLRVRIRRMRFHFGSFKQLLRFGVPVSLQTLIYPLANLQIVSAINSYGVAGVAGNSASSTVEQMVTAFRNAFGTATATFMGQNLGAEKKERVRGSLFHNLWLSLSVGAVVGLSVWATAPWWLRIFLGNDTEAIAYGTTRITIMMAAQDFAVLNAVFGHAIQAFGYPVFSTVNAVTWVLGFRIFWMAFVYPAAPSYASLIMCFAVSWVLTALCNIVILSVLYSRYRHGKYKRI